MKPSRMTHHMKITLVIKEALLLFFMKSIRGKTTHTNPLNVFFSVSYQVNKKENSYARFRMYALANGIATFPSF